jgi:hypothetical protein
MFVNGREEQVLLGPFTQRCLWMERTAEISDLCVRIVVVPSHSRSSRSCPSLGDLLSCKRNLRLEETECGLWKEAEEESSVSLSRCL